MIARIFLFFNFSGFSILLHGTPIPKLNCEMFLFFLAQGRIQFIKHFFEVCAGGIVLIICFTATNEEKLIFFSCVEVKNHFAHFGQITKIYMKQILTSNFLFGDSSFMYKEDFCKTNLNL